MEWRSVLNRLRGKHRRMVVPDGDTRNVIIHNHLFKNAGSTIDWALSKNFGDDFVDHRDDREMMRGAAYLGPYLQENSNIAALSTHHLHLPLPDIDGIQFFTIMMLRHPIERVASVYHFERRQIESDTLGARFARDHSLGEYVRWRMKRGVPPTIRNFHVFKSQSPTIDWRRSMDEGHLARSRAYIEQLGLLGFVERFDESMVIFEKVLRDRFPGIDLSYRMQNVGRWPRQSNQDRLQSLREGIGSETFDLLLQHNRLDLDLYAHAKTVFEASVAAIDTFDDDLAAFRSRCRKYRDHGA